MNINNSSLNTVKSKEFQKHTRKLLEISLEMLLKSQVPSVQYISLTTINRIFDIYVYHNLFYPGYYQSCYIPLSKRLASNRIQNQKNDNLQQQQQVDLINIGSATSNETDYCKCLQPSILKQNQSNNYYTNRFTGKLKELNSVIKEDPSDEAAEYNNDNNNNNNNNNTSPTSPLASPKIESNEINQPNLVGVGGPLNDTTNKSSPTAQLPPPPPTTTTSRRLILTKAMSISNMAHRISGFLMRKLSISGSNSSNINDSNTYLNEQYCNKCNKLLKNIDDLANNKTNSSRNRFKNTVRKAMAIKNNQKQQQQQQQQNEMIKNLQNKKDVSYNTEDENNKSDANNSDIEQDFTTSVLTTPKKVNTSPTRNNNFQNEKNNDQKMTTSSYQNQPFKCLANSIDPKFLLLIIKERLESHKNVDINATTMGGGGGGGVCGSPINTPTNTNPNNNSTNNTTTTTTTTNNSSNSSRTKCIPSARVISCQHHCVAILATRLFAILCNEKVFQKRLMNENQEVCFNLINEILYPNNDPHLLCLMLQAIGLLALNPDYHDIMQKHDLTDNVMSLILPSDELFYTNQTTKYAKYVKHLAARILVYFGCFDKLTNKVNLFDILGNY
jgi:hypothetical protein